MMPNRIVNNAEFTIENIRRDFPILLQEINGYPFTYLDSAASSQKPLCVIEKMSDAMQNYYSNIHRGLYQFSQKMTTEYEQARMKVAPFLGAGVADEIIFTRNATESINLVAATWGRANINEGDEILLTELEHHSNIVPWHMLAKETGAVLKYVPLLAGVENGLDIEAFSNLITSKTKLVCMSHMSNVTGEILPVKEITKQAHAVGAKILVDGSQAAVHLDVNVSDIDCDFYVITGHKLYAPTGIGALYGKKELLDNMPPYQGGGEMIETVSIHEITYKEAPAKFEAGTPAFIEAIGLGTALDYIQGLDNNIIREHENSLTEQAFEELQKLDGVQVFGRDVAEKSSIVSFTIDGVHPHDAATVLDQMGIAVRAGQHCAAPFMDARGVPSTLRASFAMYNTEQDLESLILGLKKVQKLFS